jgi:uncharacterized protein YegJ (DUF2314 family)
MIWIVCAVILALGSGFVFWRIRRRRRSRLLSFVALLREPVGFDQTVLARLAAKAWDADLGYGSTELDDGSSTGADGFVVGEGPAFMIKYAERMFLINNLPQPYVTDIEQTAQRIEDLRIRAFFREHQAWFSCDSLGVDGATSEDECRKWYQWLGKLFAELLDDNCLLIFVPDLAKGFPINEDTESALRSDDPLRALQATLTLPIVEVSDEDPQLKQAVEKARDEWPKFVAAYEERAGEIFSAKAPVTRDGNTEFIWISVTGIEGDLVYGTLANDPGRLGSLRFGSKVSVPVAELNDWCFKDPAGNLVGGFTIDVLKNAPRPRRRR